MVAPLDAQVLGIAAAARGDGARTGLLFDIDGVLAPIVPNAADARVPAEALDLLSVLTNRYLLVGAISGRAMADVERMVPVSGIARGGNHGLEVAAAGHDPHMVPEAAAPVAHLRAFVDALDRDALATQGAWVEDKGASVSLHYREARDPRAAGEWLRAQIRPAAVAHGLRTRDGKMILELLPDVDVDKGTALRAIARESGARRILYVGDDHTDADAWREMRRMHAQGELDDAWCVVADGPEVDPVVRCAADATVPGTGGVLALMRHLAD